MHQAKCLPKRNQEAGPETCDHRLGRFTPIRDPVDQDSVELSEAKPNVGVNGRRPQAYITGVILAGVAVAAYSISDLISHRVGPEWLILVGLTVASGWATLRIPGMP